MSKITSIIAIITCDSIFEGDSEDSITNCTHCNDGADDRFEDCGNRRDYGIDAVTDGRDNTTLRPLEKQNTRTNSFYDPPCETMNTDMCV
jgi:hypothetical protein